MFLKSSCLAFLAITLCVQASPALQPSDEVSITSSPIVNRNNGGNPTATSATTATSPSATDEQASLVLSPEVICEGFAHDGEQTPNPGQVKSLTSTNNFINFCLKYNFSLTNGKQLPNGSCNPAPMGIIPAKTKMPSSKFISPQNLATLKANQTFTVKMAINNFDPGKFVNPDSNYYAAPQQLNSKGLVMGHSHFVIQAISSLNDTKVLDATIFAFFVAVNGAAVNGIVSETVEGGLPVGHYKLSSINTAANHQPVLVPVAQHGSLDDTIYFTVTDSG